MIGDVDGPLGTFAEQLGEALEASGIVPTDDPLEADLVLNLVDVDDPKPFRRKSRGTFVAALYAARRASPRTGCASRTRCSCARSRTSSSATCRRPASPSRPWSAATTRVEENGGGPGFAHAVAERLLPLATSRLVIENEFRTDLEPELWDGDELTREIGEAGRRLDALGLLPAPFPIEELLSRARAAARLAPLRHRRPLLRQPLRAQGRDRFWMSASGVDKSKLDEPNRDILLVSGYEPADARMILSVAPDIEPRRVSVDAIEHWMIYQHHPDVGAILHVHAWMEGIAATDINYPCGTAELAGAVSDLMAAEPDPAHAVIGLRNHGITATGESLSEILDRIEPRLLRQVPMS